MHDCIHGCGQACCCDGEDHWQETPDDCCHECDECDEPGDEDTFDWLDGPAPLPKTTST